MSTPQGARITVDGAVHGRPEGGQKKKKIGVIYCAHFAHCARCRRFAVVTLSHQNNPGSFPLLDSNFGGKSRGDIWRLRATVFSFLIDNA